MVVLREEFTNFYLSHHQGRKLTYEPTLGSCVVKAIFPTVYLKLKVLSYFRYFCGKIKLWTICFSWLVDFMINLV